MKHRIVWSLLSISLIVLSKLSTYAQPGTSYPLLIGDTVPSFKVATSQGIMYFPDDYAGKWKILFSHPGDFTPVCTSELLEFALMHDDFKALNCELMGLSVDGYDNHLDWIASMENLEYKGQKGIQIRFPIISDVRMEVSRMFGMVHPHAMSTRTVRAVYIIDPANAVRAILYYPQTVGRNMEEIERLLIALQAVDKYDINTPASWQPGDDIIVASPQTIEAAKWREEAYKRGDIRCLDWYFCFKKLE
ncbi:MAG TPA: peroxiredoxin [Bacteroidales bacterium]|nr:peroxiredoxin [Bacteroidales bacterium]